MICFGQDLYACPSPEFSGWLPFVRFRFACKAERAKSTSERPGVRHMNSKSWWHDSQGLDMPDRFAVQGIVAMLVPAMQVPAPMGTMPGFPIKAQAVAMFCTQPMAMGTQPMAMCTQPMAMCTQPMAMATQPEGLQPKKEWSSCSSSDSTSDSWKATASFLFGLRGSSRPC